MTRPSWPVHTALSDVGVDRRLVMALLPYARRQRVRGSPKPVLSATAIPRIGPDRRGECAW